MIKHQVYLVYLFYPSHSPFGLLRWRPAHRWTASKLMVSHSSDKLVTLMSHFRNFFRRYATRYHHENVSKSFLDYEDKSSSISETNAMFMRARSRRKAFVGEENHMKQEMANRLIVCSTQGSSFVIMGATCIAVKDRDSREWVEDHYAIGERVSLVPTSRTRSQLRAWRLTIFIFRSRIEIGNISSVSPLTSEEWDYIRSSDRYGHLLGMSLDNEYEYDGGSPKCGGRERYRGIDEINPMFSRLVGKFREESDIPNESR
jgi:hypothetical protein